MVHFGSAQEVRMSFLSKTQNRNIPYFALKIWPQPRLSRMHFTLNEWEMNTAWSDL